MAAWRIGETLPAGHRLLSRLQILGCAGAPGGSCCNGTDGGNWLGCHLPNTNNLLSTFREQLLIILILTLHHAIYRYTTSFVHWKLRQHYLGQNSPVNYVLDRSRFYIPLPHVLPMAMSKTIGYAVVCTSQILSLRQGSTCSSWLKNGIVQVGSRMCSWVDGPPGTVSSQLKCGPEQKRRDFLPCIAEAFCLLHPFFCPWPSSKPRDRNCGSSSGSFFCFHDGPCLSLSFAEKAAFPLDFFFCTGGAGTGRDLLLLLSTLNTGEKLLICMC